MKSCDFTDKTEIAALFLVYPVLKTVCKNRDVSAVYVRPAADIVGFGSDCGNGFNCSGWIFRVKKGEIISEITWDEIRTKQKELHYKDWYRNTAKTVLTGEEDMIVFAESHHKEDHADVKWISMDIFICADGKTFSQYEPVMAWIKESEIRKRVQEILV